MSIFPSLVRSVSPSGELRYALGDPLVVRYLEFVAGRCRPNTLRATAFDLKTFFTVVRWDPVAVTAADVFEFLATQRGDRRVVRISDRESGLSARTIARRLQGCSGLCHERLAYGWSPSVGAAASTLRSVCAAPSRPADSNGTTVFALGLSANFASVSS